jgi:alkanesulfonate monooxygenase SsuD/methylene tetrahydromethanopterin reductase-like flavin-dependent oxidoreductase (luciferase family)
LPPVERSPHRFQARTAAEPSKEGERMSRRFRRHTDAGGIIAALAKQSRTAASRVCSHRAMANVHHLAAAAVSTERVKLASGIAIAPVRSPFETAMSAVDMDHLSGGRFILGLGTSVHAWTSGVFGTPKYKPVSHLRETVAAVRHIVAGAHKGLEPFEGEYYRADFRELQPIAPPVRERIPIWIAALRSKLVALAAEVGDGLIGHPMWSAKWTLEKMKPEFEAELARAGRKRDAVEVNLWPWVAPNDDERAAIEDSRPTMAFYGGIKQYEPFFEAHGFGDVARNWEGVVTGITAASPTWFRRDGGTSSQWATGKVREQSSALEVRRLAVPGAAVLLPFGESRRHYESISADVLLKKSQAPFFRSGEKGFDLIDGEDADGKEDLARCGWLRSMTIAPVHFVNPHLARSPVLACATK